MIYTVKYESDLDDEVKEIDIDAIDEVDMYTQLLEVEDFVRVKQIK